MSKTVDRSSLRAVVLRFAAVARWDCRRSVVALQLWNDGKDVIEALVSIVVGAVMLPVAVITLVLRWPLKPLEWLWLAWRHPESVERARTIIDQAQNSVLNKPGSDNA